MAIEATQGTAATMASAISPAVESIDHEVQLNPYMLHHSIAPTTTLVTQQLQGASNYVSWSRAMVLALSGKNKLGFINGSIKKPIGALSSAWQCNNDIIMSWIVNSVSKQIAASLIYTDCVKDVWDQLKRRYHQVSGSRIYQLRKDLVTTNQGLMSVEDYYAKLSTIWQELNEYRPLNKCVCDGSKTLFEHLDSEFVMTFLMGLNESYSAVRAQILLKNPLPLIDEVFSLIVHEEHQRTINSLPNTIESVTLLASTDHSRKSFNTDRFKRRDSQRPLCTHCGNKGHTIDRCYKLHGYPPGYRTPTSTRMNPQTPAVGLSSAPPAHTVKPNQSAFFASLNEEQYSSLMAMMHSHLQTPTINSEASTSEIRHVAGRDRVPGR